MLIAKSKRYCLLQNNELTILHNVWKLNFRVDAFMFKFCWKPQRYIRLGLKNAIFHQVP